MTTKIHALTDQRQAPVAIRLTAGQAGDNPQYVFDDPGFPQENPPATVCAHCHRTLNADSNGEVHLRATLPGSVCGRVAQMLDTASCELTNTVSL
mgnify:CR=1 FL=1